MTQKILILDFGSQYTQLIARRIREQKVYCEIHPYNLSIQKIKAFNPLAIILSGGPASVSAKKAPKASAKIFDLEIPILGICYGMQWMAKHLGGKVIPAKKREYGSTEIEKKSNHPLFKAHKKSFTVWMSHGDTIEKLPPQFKTMAQTENKIIAAITHQTKPWLGLQFHPEVTHTQLGDQIIKRFLTSFCKAKFDWSMSSFIEDSIQKIRTQVGNKKVILGLSGGVDSSVAAVLLHQAIGKQLTPIFVNNGLLRADEANTVRSMFKQKFSIKLRYVNASELFLKELAGVTNPEKKRKIIGRVFIDVFRKEAKKIKGASFLAQGTLYPDVIESVSPTGGPSVTIKSHHNVGGLPKKLGFDLVEPFRELFKDEVRQIGRELKLPEQAINRHPFPGPGLAIRIIGEITKVRLHILRKADQILLEEIKKAGIYNQIWQALAVLLPLKTVGVMGDSRTYESVLAIRCVNSLDGMTANFFEMDPKIMGKISARVINEVKGINRVVYDISSKPPATIEWE